MKIQTNRYPYMFPAWIDGQFQQLTANDILEIEVELLEQNQGYYKFKAIDPDYDDYNEFIFEFIEECFDIIEK